jgi:hypothetical protein
MPAVVDINLESDEAQRVICKREPDEVGIIIFMKMLSFLCRN